MHVPCPPVGGAFLVEEATPEQILTPEDLPAEARCLARTMEDFVRREVLPLVGRLEAQETGLMRRLLQKAGDLGLLAVAVPEAYGGLDLPRSVLALLAEKAAPYPAFALALGVHTGVATLPLVTFGTPEQKAKYLPKLAGGAMIGAFALSEANSGSDALAAKTRAVLAPDGAHYRLSGTKLWVTNAGFADLFTVFAQVNGERFTAFLVERDTPGLTLGPEERKMGLHGSSTRRLLLEDARVPVANVLGGVGEGRRVALHPLNVGRFHIGAGALGAGKEILRTAARYARERKQFGRPLAEFGLIRHKLAEMAVRLFALESMVYRTAGYRDRVVSPEEYAVECALVKFFGTEALGYVADEGLQIHGGFGYSEEYPAARAYRDARVTRIFEGTNEINRLTVLDQLLRRARQGRLDLRLPQATLAGVGEVGAWVRQIRRAILYTLGAAREALGDDGLIAHQEIAGALADMIAALYALESAGLRAGKMGTEAALAITRVYGNDACAEVERRARYTVAAFSAGDALRGHVAELRRLLDPPLIDTVALRHRIAADVAERVGT